MRAEDVVLATELLTYVVAATSTACSLLLLYVVWLHSPREMGAYKWYILFNSASCAAYDIYYAAAHPEPLFPAPLMAAGGIFRWKVLAQLPEPIVRLGINFVGLALYGVSSGIVAIIVFRFRQAATGKVLFGLLSPKQFYLGCMFVLVISPVILIVPCNLVVETSRDVIYERIANSNPEVVPLLQDRIVVGIKEINSKLSLFTLCYGVCFVCCVSSAAWYCVFGCYYSLRQSVGVLSPTTLRLYRSLVNSMVLDCAICGTLGVLPISVAIVCFSVRSERAKLVVQICMEIASFYPPISHIVWLLNITPYRRAVFRILGLRRCCKSISKATLFVSSSVTDTRV